MKSAVNEDNDDKWEQELQRDLQEFEMVTGADLSSLDEEALAEDLLELKGQKSGSKSNE